LKKIYRTYEDTEVVELAVKVECPHCGNKWMEDGKTDCGESYVINCGDDGYEDGCGKDFEMYFDAS
jgi:predicted RNA-binding Zn-ribbon protein involved in translation (DUF1610 family)